VECTLDPQIQGHYPDQWGARVTIGLDDGMEREATVLYPKGDPENPVSFEDLAEKFRGITDGIIPEKQAHRLIEAVGHLESLKRVSTLWET